MLLLTYLLIAIITRSTNLLTKSTLSENHLNLVRNPGNEKAQTLVRLGAELVEGNFNDPDSSIHSPIRVTSYLTFTTT